MARSQWGWSLSHPPSFDFNNVSVLKSYLYHSDGAATLAELKQALRRELKRDYTDEQLQLYMEPLNRQPDLFTVEGELARLRMENLKENDQAVDLLREEWAPLTLNEIRKEVARRLGTHERHLLLTLDKDHRFVQFQGPRVAYYGLTRWQIVNDRAYTYLARTPGKHQTVQEVLDGLRGKGEIPKDAIFWPKVDDRFTKKGSRWGLKEWSLPKAAAVPKDPIQQTNPPPVAPEPRRPLDPPRPPEKLEPPALEPVVVTTEIRQRVLEQVEQIAAYARGQEGSVSLGEILRDLFNMDLYDPDYRAVRLALEEFLGENPEWVQVGVERWMLQERLPNSLKPPVRNGSTRVQWREEVAKVWEEADSEEATQEQVEEEEVIQGERPVRVRLVLTYPHFVNGSILIPRSRRQLFPTGQGTLVEARLKDEYYQEVRAWYEPATGLLHGLGEWYHREGMQPGSIFVIERELCDQSDFRISNPGQIDERSQLDQERFVNLEEARRKAREVNKPFYVILMDVLAPFPEGLPFHEIWQLVNSIRPVAVSTVANLLSQMVCFDRIGGEPGNWRFDPDRRDEAVAKLRSRVRLKVMQVKLPAEPVDPPAELVDPPVEPVDPPVEPVNSTVEPVGPPVEPVDLPVEPKEEAEPEDTIPRGVRSRVALLIQEDTQFAHNDKALIATYLKRFHGIDLGPSFLAEEVPGPETIRRAWQKIKEDGHVPAPDSVAGRVWDLTQEIPLATDSQLQAVYYHRFHGFEAALALYHEGVPALESIRRSRQQLVKGLPEDETPPVPVEHRANGDGKAEEALHPTRPKANKEATPPSETRLGPQHRRERFRWVRGIISALRTWLGFFRG